MQIFIQTFQAKMITLHIENGGCIQDIKQGIQDKEGYSKDQQRLSLHDKPLEDDCLLSSYDIQPGTVLHLRIDLKVYLQLVDGKIHTFIVEPDEKLDNLKQRINDKLGIPLDSQCIIHRGIQVEGNRPLSSYVFDENTHNIIIKLRGH